MSENIAVALQIAFIGMTLVFMSILLFWLIISLLVKATAERVVEPVVAADDEAEQERKRRAVATAVATRPSPGNKYPTTSRPAHSPHTHRQCLAGRHAQQYSR